MKWAYKFYHKTSRALQPLLSLKDLPPERKGFLPGPVDLWIHASSVGEAQVAAAIIKNLLTIKPSLKILLTLFTSTGEKKARELLEDQKVQISLAPYDLSPFIQKAWENTKAKVLVLIETEIWPNIINYAHQSGAKIFLLNGRISSKSFKYYRCLRSLLSYLWNFFSGLAVIGNEEAQRFKALGVPSSKITILGNAKHDLLEQRIKNINPSKIKERLYLSKERVIIFGSIRKGEERSVAKVIKELHKQKDLFFIIAPRHLELIGPIIKNLQKEGLSFEFWRDLHFLKLKRRKNIIILDEIGPLFELYSIAYLAFVGGSLISQGGQNPMEPAAFGVPVLFGPYMDNFSTEARSLRKWGAGFVVKNNVELLFYIEELLTRSLLYKQASAGAKQALKQLTGSASRQAQWLASHF